MTVEIVRQFGVHSGGTKYYEIVRITEKTDDWQHEEYICGYGSYCIERKKPTSRQSIFGLNREDATKKMRSKAKTYDFSPYEVLDKIPSFIVGSYKVSDFVARIAAQMKEESSRTIETQTLGDLIRKQISVKSQPQIESTPSWGEYS